LTLREVIESAVLSRDTTALRRRSSIRGRISILGFALEGP
jgi:hypothetical protein